MSGNFGLKVTSVTGVPKEAVKHTTCSETPLKDRHAKRGLHEAYFRKSGDLSSHNFGVRVPGARPHSHDRLDGVVSQGHLEREGAPAGLDEVLAQALRH